MLFLLAVCVTLCESARILVVIPTPSYSHQITLQPIWKELAVRGHDVVVLTTDPLKDATITNLREIDLGFSHELWKEGMTRITDNFGIGSMLTMVDVAYEIMDRQMMHPEVQALLHNETEYFDLLIGEYIGGGMFAFKERFRCPFIGFCSMDLPGQRHELIGNAKHAIAYPDPLFGFPETMNVFQRVAQIIGSILFELLFSGIFASRDTALIKKHFGEDYPSVEELARSVDMVFVNANPVFYTVRPVSPATIIISGGIHIRDPQPLPEDLQTFFNNSKNGVIYFSLGSNVKSTDIPPTTKQIIIETLSELPYDILWKYEDEHLTDKPSNVKLVKWAPQQDILRHPKVKVFITQGGLQSLEEALFNHVPVLSIPFVFDQHYNARRLAERGIGLTLDYNTMTKEDFMGGILEVAQNPKYKNRMRELAELIRDEPVPALKKAVWWTEYVLRHGGAQHLKAKTIPYYQFYYVDVIGFLLSAVAIVYFSIKACFKCVCRSKLKKD